MTYTYVVTEVKELLQQWRTKWHTLVREEKARRNAGNIHVLPEDLVRASTYSTIDWIEGQKLRLKVHGCVNYFTFQRWPLKNKIIDTPLNKDTDSGTSSINDDQCKLLASFLSCKLLSSFQTKSVSMGMDGVGQRLKFQPLCLRAWKFN